MLEMGFHSFQWNVLKVCRGADTIVCVLWGTLSTVVVVVVVIIIIFFCFYLNYSKCILQADSVSQIKVF